MEKKNKLIGKKDIILALVLLLIALVLFLVFRMMSTEKGSIVQVRIDGEVWDEFPLAQDKEIEIETELGRNVLHIENGQACMAEADCPDGYCVDKGKISQENEIIVCLPHKLTAEVIAGEDDTGIPGITEDTADDSDTEPAIDVVAQ